MGFYIDPTQETKEQWLARNAQEGPLVVEKNVDGDNVAVCLVDNGAFTAAGICWCQEELEAFKQPDGRMKIWFWVPIKAVEPFMHGQKIVDGRCGPGDVDLM